MKPAAWRWPAIVAVLVVLVGCGFHLRTWDLRNTMENAYVSAGPRHALADPLRRALRQAGVNLTEDREGADMVIELQDQRDDRRSASVSGEARVTEYELSYAVLYRVMDADGVELVPSQWVERQEVYRVDRDNIVGSSEEQDLLVREMRNDVVQQILRTLAAVAPRTESAG